MMDNPCIQPGSKLHTYDLFDDYIQATQLRKLLTPAVEKGLLEEKALPVGDGKVAFSAVFDLLHANSSYEQLLHKHAQGVPDRAEDAASGSWLKLSSQQKCDAVFIDGCKSWYGTKYFFMELAGLLKPGAHVICQDYGWFTCFWLPCFMALFGDNFRIVAGVDATYCFVVTRALERSDIEERFPDVPETLGGARLAALIDTQIAAAESRRDPSGAFRLALQKVGAHAYVGERDEAFSALKELQNFQAYEQHLSLYHLCQKSPTYRPDGPVYLMGKDDK
jgi:hypothetical protein